MYPKHRCCTPDLKDIKRSEYSRASKGKKRFFRGLAASKENCCSWHRGVPLLQERPHIKEDHWTKQPFQTGRWRLERERIRRSESKSKRKDREQDKLEKEGRETPRFSKRHIQKRYPRHLKQSTCKIHYILQVFRDKKKKHTHWSFSILRPQLTLWSWPGERNATKMWEPAKSWL